MSGILDYIGWRGDLSFQQDPPNAVDALIFSTLVYIRYGGHVEAEPNREITLRDAAEEYFALEDPENRVRVKNDLELLRLAAESRRFGFTRLVGYEDVLLPQQETQFAACTYLLDDGSAFLAFRGTDSSLIGWKEDFNMTFQQTIPSQRMAQQYVRRIAAEYPLPLRLGGHSKGGNLAVFAAARSSPMVQQRILEVYNNDGPGFTDYMMGDPGYLAMVPRIKTFIPQSSVIGMLLEHQEVYRVVVSNRFGLMQHDPFSWEIDGSDFHMAEQLTDSASLVNETLHDWICTLSDEKRALFVDALFSVLESTGATTTKELSAAWLREAPAVLAAIKGLDEETTAFLLETLKQLGALYMHNMNVRIPRLPALGHKPGAQADKSEQREKTAEN